MEETVARFFRARALGGSLHLLDLNDWETWDPGRVSYRDETETGWLIRMGGDGHRIVRTAIELDVVLRESVSVRVLHLYIGEALLDDARRRWEDMKHKYKQ
jgi:hypothetical protein